MSDWIKLPSGERIDLSKYARATNAISGVSLIMDEINSPDAGFVYFTGADAEAVLAEIDGRMLENVRPLPRHPHRCEDCKGTGWLDADSMFGDCPRCKGRRIQRLADHEMLVEIARDKWSDIYDGPGSADAAWSATIEALVDYLRGGEQAPPTDGREG